MTYSPSPDRYTAMHYNRCGRSGLPSDVADGALERELGVGQGRGDEPVHRCGRPEGHAARRARAQRQQDQHGCLWWNDVRQQEQRTPLPVEN